MGKASPVMQSPAAPGLPQLRRWPRRSRPRRSLNVSGYVEADPINFVDPLGLMHQERRCVDTGERGSEGEVIVRLRCYTVWVLDEWDFASRRWSPLSRFDLRDYTADVIVTAYRRFRNNVTRRIRSAFCKLPSVNVGGGADLYAIAGGSIGGGVDLDFSHGRFGLSGYTGVGVGIGADIGPNFGAGPSGGGIVSANLAISGGFAAPVLAIGNLGASGTYNFLGTDRGFSGGAIGRAGTPLLYGNVGANIGFATPSLYSCD